jgi:hypothetical protein
MHPGCPCKLHCSGIGWATKGTGAKKPIKTEGAAVKMEIDFSSCLPGPKDMLDAFAASVTVREFVHGNGTEVGNGDGLGSIVFPLPLPEPVISVVRKRL